MAPAALGPDQHVSPEMFPPPPPPVIRPTDNPHYSSELVPPHLPPREQPRGDSSASLMSSTRTLALQSARPVVIPQTSRALRGVYYSPFLRAYPEALAELGISKPEFIRFVDNLNEAFISSPFFYAMMVAGAAVSFVPELAAQIVGSVVATASSFASKANSHVRSKLFVKAANKDIFAPHGLQLRILSTKKMLAAIDVDEGEFELPPLPEFNEPETEQEQDDPRRRWMQALENVVAPLDYNAPEFTEQDNWLKKAGAWTAKHQDKRQANSLNKRREKAKKKIDDAAQEAVQSEQTIEGTIGNLEAKLYWLSLRVANDERGESRRMREVAECEKAIHEEQVKLLDARVKQQEVTEKTIGKVDRKEQKVVQKIRWIVITPGTASEVDDSDMDDGVEDVSPLKRWRSRAGDSSS